jgi:hypothetical protein
VGGGALADTIAVFDAATVEKNRQSLGTTSSQVAVWMLETESSKLSHEMCSRLKEKKTEYVP